MIFGKYIEKKIESLKEYKNLGGLKGLEKAKNLEAIQIIEEIKKSELRGRGGAGFPTGFKLELGYQNKEVNRWIICNADEGEMGAFKDRELLTKCPYLVLEGLTIAGLAVGAQKGYIYLRDEYTYFSGRLEKAIEELNKSGMVEKPFPIELKIGAGAYICGEETALIESIEEKRGEPRQKPPFPPQSGLFNLPTIIINVETVANIPWIITNGAQAFSKIGTEKSKGTKLFSVSGDVKNPGVYELPMGASLRQLVYDCAGAQNVKFVQVGGASGKVVRGDNLDRALCFEDIIGAGAAIVFDNTRNVVETMREVMLFFMEESCGKCTPCREGNWVIHAILDRMSRGQGKKSDIQSLRDVSETMIDTSFCGLGLAAPTGLLDSLALFEDEFQAALETVT
ncbi:MAG TPA: NADH-quinone oxidoreductase subunit F [Spirochaetes bacterium]|nr:NADH-quinone oxidoreductase subunit F [Spirochaetota bacterium]